MADFRHNTLYYTSEQAAGRLQCSKSRVHRLIRSGAVRLVSVGGKWVIPAEDIDAVLNANGPDAPDPAGSPSQSPTKDFSNRQENPTKDRQSVDRALESGEREDYYYSRQQAREMLGISLGEINRLVRDGELRAIHLKYHNKSGWITAKSLEDLVRRKYGSRKLLGASEPVLIPKPGKPKTEDVRSEDTKIEPEHLANTLKGQEGETASLESEDAYYTVEEVAEKLRKPQGEIWRMVFFKKLQTETIGDRRMFPKRPIDDLLRKPTRAGEGYYSDEEVASKLGKDTDEIWEMVYRNQLPVVWMGGKRVFSKRAVEDILDQREPPATDVRESVVNEERDRTPRSSTPSGNTQSPTQDSPDAGRQIPQASSSTRKNLEKETAEHRERLMAAAQRWGTSIRIVKQMIREGTLVLDPETNRLIHRNEVSVRSADDNGERGVQDPPEAQAAEASRQAPPESAAARAEEPEQELWMLQDELRAQRERNERLDEKLQQERAVHDQEMAQARYEIDRLDAEIENLRRARTALSETLHEDLEEERYKRVQAENIVEQLRDDLHEEIERRIEAERAHDDSSSGEDFYGRLSSRVKSVVGSFTDSLSDEDEEGREEVSDLQSRIERLKTQLEEERDNRSKKEEWAAGLQSQLEQGEAKIREMESALSVEREQRLRLEDEKRVLDEVRRLLGVEDGQPRQPMVRAEAPEPEPTAAEPEGEQPDSLVLITPYGPYAFDPPFPLSDQEVKLLRFVAREEEITEEQIRRHKGRRALQTLNDLLDRLTDEGANPILEVNDRYSFDRSNLQSD